MRSFASWFECVSDAAFLLIVFLVLAIVLSMLAGCALPDKTYIAADRATYERIAPAHRAYLRTDLALDDVHRQAKLDILDSWRRRIETAESEATK